MLLLTACSAEMGREEGHSGHDLAAPSFAEIAARKGRKNQKVTICHRTGKPGKFVTIEVDEHAVASHLEHGDRLGSCDDDPPPPPPPDDDSDDIAVPSSAVSFFEGVEFLFQGDSASQTGVDEGAIDPRRTAVIRGTVLTRDGGPLSGVRLTILGNPQLGETSSRSDGSYDLAVNGGGVLTVSYEKEGFLPAHRTVSVPWNDYVFAPDVVLIPRDDQVNILDLSTDSMQVVRSAPVSDASGSRVPTLLVREGTTATMLFPTGTRRQLNTVEMRLTEYTVGENGPLAMPAQLPPTSAYTYCVEFSVDEADELGATTVEFDPPLIHYVENFLSIPDGTPVPVGVYDRGEGCWMPEKDGRVVRIVAIEDGQAVLDFEGNGQPSSQAVLTAFGVTDNELERLAELYGVGQSLWRIEVPHFSPIDGNFPTTTNTEIPEADEASSEDEAKDDCDTLTTGSIVEITNQILRERLGVVGTPFSLNYASDRVPGRVAANTVRIPLTGDTIPPELQRIDLEISVAGQRVVESFPPQTELTHTFTWDGKDAYGRTVQGRVPVTIKTGYAVSEYYTIPEGWAESFALPGGDSTGIPVRENAVIERIQRVFVGNWDARGSGLGGWGLSVHHSYDPTSQTLYLGDGSRRQAPGDIIDTVAGTGEAGFAGDGGPALEASLQVPQGIAMAADGSIYISDTLNNRIRRIGADGTIDTVAGTGAAGFNGDGPALFTQLSGPNGIAVAPDGSLYIADTVNRRVRRLSPDGQLTTVAGNGSTEYTGDEQSALNVGIRPVSVDLGPDCAIYIADLNGAVRRVSPDGVITTFAGTGVLGYSGDGGPAREAQMAAVFDVSISPAGEVVIADTNNNRIRKVGLDGIITTIAGTGQQGFSADGFQATQASLGLPVSVCAGPGEVIFSEALNFRIRKIRSDGTLGTVAGNGVEGFAGDGGPAVAAQLGLVVNLGGTAGAAACMAPDGSLYLADSRNNRIRRVTSGLSGSPAGEFGLPSADGGLFYKFDSGGRHLQTINSLTGGVLYSFEYNSNGRLSAITDGDGNVTRIEGNSNGPTAIVGPFGQRTTLTVDGNGYLNTVANPAGEVFQLAYTDNGLLSSLVDPNGNAPYQFLYDELGRLVKDIDPAGGFKDLARTELGEGFEVSVTTAEGRVSRYRLEHLPTGDKRRTRTDADGLQGVAVSSPDGTTSITLKDGTQINFTQTLDPRFGMQAPRIGSATVTAGGLTSTATWSRIATLSDPADPLSLTQLSTTTTVNGRSFTSLLDAAAHSITRTTPQGRQVVRTFDGLGRLLSMQSPGAAGARWDYDSFGRLVSASLSSGSDTRTVQLGYDAQGRPRTITDPLGRVTTIEYDLAGRVLSATLPGGRVIAAGYDANSNLVTLTPPGRPSHAFGYTPVNLPDLYTPPPSNPGGDTAHTFNLDRQPLSSTKPDGGLLNFDYDAAGRLEGLTFDRGVLALSYSDSSGNLVSRTAPGGETIKLGYAQGLNTSWTSSGTAGGGVGWTYDNDFRRRTRMVMGGSALNLDYDRDGRLVRLGSMTLDRDSQTGRLIGSTLYQIRDILLYNAFGEVTEYDASASGSSLYSETIQRDRLGRIQRRTELVSGVASTFDYSYDPAGRLQEVKVDGQVSTYGYDLNGNRTSLAGPAGTILSTYDEQDRLLTEGSETFSYNADGDLESRSDAGETTSYDYDSIGNLMGVKLADGRQIEYRVDAYGRRLAKIVDGMVVRKWLYAGGLLPVAEMDANDRIISTFNGAYLVRNGVPYRTISDQLGSPRLVVEATTGEVVQELNYDEWGNVTKDTNPGFQPFGYAGGLYDPDTELVRFGARDYDPSIGRFLTQDPIGFGGGLNQYTYVDNDPINHVDPSGLQVATEEEWEALRAALPPPEPSPEALEEYQRRLQTLDEGYQLLQTYWLETQGAGRAGSELYDNSLLLQRAYDEGLIQNDVSFLGAFFGASAETQGNRILVSSETLDVTVPFVAWVLAHESEHLSQAWWMKAVPILKERDPNLLADEELLRALERFYDSLCP